MFASLIRPWLRHRSSTRPLRAAVLLLMPLSFVGCYTVSIGESFWLNPRPGAGADLAIFRQRLPAEYRIRPFALAGSTGDTLRGIVAVRPNAAATVLFLGGDNFVLAKGGPEVLARLTAAAPVNVVLTDYAGYGASGGRPTLAGLKADALTVYDWAAAQPELGGGALVVHGHSLGSFVAASVADARSVQGLVLQSSATNPREWMRGFIRPSRLRWWAKPAYYLVRFRPSPAIAREDNVDRVGRSRAPLLLLVGEDDNITAPAMSAALFAASAAPDSLRWLVELPGSDHENVLQNPGFAPAYGAFVAALSRAAPAK